MPNVDIASQDEINSQREQDGVPQADTHKKVMRTWSGRILKPTQGLIEIMKAEVLGNMIPGEIFCSQHFSRGINGKFQSLFGV